MTASTGSLIVPLSADFTKADVQDNQIYPAITLPSLPQGVRYMAADCGYDDHKLYNLSITRGFELVMSGIRNIQLYFQRQITVDTFLRIRIRTGNLLLEKHICRTVNRTHQRRLQNRYFTSKRVPESSWTSTPTSTTLSNHCLLQL
jgi:DDE family transposase